MELIEEIIGIPRVYKAVSIRDGASILLQHKKEEHDQIEIATKEMFKRFKNQEKIGTEPQFCLTHVKMEAPNKRMVEAWRSVQKNVSMYYGDKENYMKAITLRPDVWMEFIDRGLRVRIIAEEPNKNETYKKIIDRLSKNANFHLKYSSKIVSSFVLFDDREVWLSTGIEDGFKGSLWLWSTYPSIGKLFYGFFEKLWNET
jgi:sugar-specific transcriptional regulator TrmB